MFNPGHSGSDQDFADKFSLITPRIASDRLHFEEKMKLMISFCLWRYSAASSSESAIAS